MSAQDRSEDDLSLSQRKAQLQQRPLIEHANNRWLDEKSSYSTFEDQHEASFCDLEGEGSCPQLTRDAVSSRRFRRMALTLLILVVIALWTWKWFLRPRWQEEWDLGEGFLSSENGTYGIAMGGHFDGERIVDLREKLLPGGEHDRKGKRRLVFVGDIHGCADELRNLLKKVKFNEKTDHLVAVGDVISKGPDSVGVLDELIRLDATSVRGNHEDRILTIAPSVLSSALEPPTEASSSKGYAKDVALLRQFSKHHIKFLHNMPLMLRIPALPLAAETSDKSSSPIGDEMLVVHAGLVPAVSLEKQDPYFVMNMRSIHTKTHAPMAEAEDKKAKTKPWHDIWCWYNDRLSKHKSLKDFQVWDDPLPDFAGSIGSGGFQSMSGRKYPDPQVVIYGHRSKEGLQLHRWTKGLDTGCVSGGELTAMVLDAQGRYEIVSVGCEDYRS